MESGAHIIGAPSYYGLWGEEVMLHWLYPSPISLMSSIATGRSCRISRPGRLGYLALKAVRSCPTPPPTLTRSGALVPTNRSVWNLPSTMKNSNHFSPLPDRDICIRELKAACCFSTSFNQSKNWTLVFLAFWKGPEKASPGFLWPLSMR